MFNNKQFETLYVSKYSNMQYNNKMNLSNYLCHGMKHETMFVHQGQQL